MHPNIAARKEQAADKIETLTKTNHAKLKKPVVSEDGRGCVPDLPIKLIDDIHQEGLAISNDGVVSWTDRSVLHPSKWPLRRKLFDTSVILFFEFFT